MVIYPIPGKYRTDDTFDISIIIPMYNSKKVITDQIRQWPNDNEHLKVEIIYVNDNCPEHSSQAVMQGWKNKIDPKFTVKLLLNKTNQGFGQTCNIGAYHAKGKYLIFLNADTRPEPNWLKPVYDLFESDENIGIIGNLQLKEGGEHHGTIDSAGSEWYWPDTNFVHIGRHILNGELLDKPLFPEELNLTVSEKEMVTGCCLSISKKLFDHIGGFNHYYRLGYWEDSELCMVVRELGYKIMLQPNSIVWHKLSHANIGEHSFHDINKQYFINKWDNSSRLDELVNTSRLVKRNEVKKILIRREASNGDVLLASGIAAALKKKYKNATIDFCTACRHILENNPWIDKFVDQYQAFNNLHKYNLVVELDGIYERRPNVSILQAYADEAGVLVNDMEFFVHTESYPIQNEYIVIHAGMTNWMGRNWSDEKFCEIAQKLLDQGHQVICIGQGGDREVPCTKDLRSRINLYEMSDVIKNAKLFIGIDSMPMHIAQAHNTPGVCFFGSIKPELRIYRENMKSVTATNLACLGCHHRQIAPVTSLKLCETKTLDCENLVTTEMMWKVIEGQLCNQNI